MNGDGEATHISATMGDVSGQVAVGVNVTQAGTSVTTGGPSPEDLATIRALVEELSRRVETDAPDDKKSGAIERVHELGDALTAEKPDLSTIAYVRQWFTRNLPELAGAVVGVLVNPVVGAVLTAAGVALQHDDE